MLRIIRIMFNPITWVFLVAFLVVVGVGYQLIARDQQFMEEFPQNRTLRIVAVSVSETRLGIFYQLPNGELRSIGFQADSASDPLYGLVVISDGVSESRRVSQILFKESGRWDADQILKVSIDTQCFKHQKC